MLNFRLASTQMHRMREGFQTQAPLNRTQETTQWGEAIPVPKVPQALLTQWILQPAHKPQVLILQASSASHHHCASLRCVTLVCRLTSDCYEHENQQDGQIGQNLNFYLQKKSNFESFQWVKERYVIEYKLSKSMQK